MPLRPGPLLLVGVPLVPMDLGRLRDVIHWVDRAELRSALVRGVRGSGRGFERIPMPDRILEQEVHPAVVSDRVPPSTFVDRVSVAPQPRGDSVQKSVAYFSNMDRNGTV